ncbi:MAG: hypothetical protein R2939_03930 [Kofleriaceae bacterium]
MLERIEGGLPDLHIGVVTTDTGCARADAGDDGLLSITRHVETGPNRLGRYAPAGTEACSTAPGTRYLTANAGADVTSLRDDFACIASVGTQGCGLEAPLEAMRRALENPANGDFVRDDALLAVVFIGDEDDCSAASDDLFEQAATPYGLYSSFRCFEYGVTCEGPSDPRTPGSYTDCVPAEGSPLVASVAEYQAFLRGVKADPRDVIVARIAAPPTPVRVVPTPAMGTTPAWVEVDDSCGYTIDGFEDAAGTFSLEQRAFPAIRLDAFMTAFPQREFATTICDEDLSDGLVAIGEFFRDQFGYPCLDVPLYDANPALPGLQAECSVVQVVAPDRPEETRTTIPTCADAGAERPCWEFGSLPDQCEPGVEAFVIQRAPGEMQPRGTVVEIACAVAPPEA